MAQYQYTGYITASQDFGLTEFLVNENGIQYQDIKQGSDVNYWSIYQNVLSK